MKATQILKHENQAVLLVLAEAEKEVAWIEKTAGIHVQTVRTLVDYLDKMVDQCHQQKEEKHLFILVHRRGMPIDTGALSIMLQEHERGREYLRVVREAVGGGGIPDAAAIQRIRENLSAYIQLYRSHMDKENRVLYSMADRVLDEHDQALLSEAFAVVDASTIGAAIPVYQGVQDNDEARPGMSGPVTARPPVDREDAASRAEADRRALETLVRVHAALYAVSKDELRRPGVAMADKALADGSADEMIALLSGDMSAAIRVKFHQVHEARKIKSHSVEAERDFLKMYVTYMQYIEGLHAAVTGTGGGPCAEKANMEGGLHPMATDATIA